MKFSLLASAALVAFAASAISAQASCGDVSRAIADQVPIRLPQTPTRPAPATTAPSIVGMWNVVYSAGGNTVYQALEQWHSDGLEWEFADIPTISGDVCMGVWSKVEARLVKLYHTGWTFDSSGNPNGTMVLTHTDQIAPDGQTFSGKFVLKFFDTAGNLVNKVAGEDNGTRIPAP